jgi:integrase
VSDNPCRRVDKPRREGGDPDIRFLDAEELDALLRESGAGPLGETDRTLFLTGAMTGLRRGELLALRWRDVDWLAGRVRVRRSIVRGQLGTPKSKRSSRSVPLADRVAAELERHFQCSRFRDDDDLVFCNPEHGTPLDASKVRKRFKEALKRAGVRDVRFHDLRHTFGTRMAAAGVPIRTLQEWMGHRSSQTTEVYADYAPSDRETGLVESAFAPAPIPGSNPGSKLNASPYNSTQLEPQG